MRSVTSLLLLITLLLGAVSAVKHHDIKHAHHEVLKTVHSTLASLHKVHGLHTGLFHVGKNTTAAAHHKHTFGAHQSPAATPAAPRGSCDQDGFSAAQVTVLQACPSLSGLVSGTVTPQEFLPGFCGSNCFNVIARELPRFSACLDGTTAFLASWVVTCQVTPRCFSEGYIRGGISVQSQCGSMNALTQFSNFTTAAMNDVTTACTNGCITRSLDLASTYPECVTGSDGARIDVTALRALYGHLCTTYNGQYCAWNLRSLGRIDCDSNCYSSSSYCDNSCSLALNNDRLNAMCTPCLAGVVRFVGAVGQDAVAVANSVEFMCGRAVPGDNTTSYCYIAAGQQISAATSYLATNTSQASACSGAAGRCLPRYFALGASLAAYSAGATFKACIRYGYYSSASCLRNYESSLRSAESSRVIGDIVCAQNAANSYCMPYFYAVAGSSCPYYAALGTSCPSSCATEGSAIVTNAGCCLPLINDFLRMSSTTYPAQYLPSQGGVTLSYTGANYSYSFTSSYSRGSIDRSQQPLNYLAVCGTNSSDLWSAIESGCPASANAVNRSLAVNLAWSRVNANPAFKAQLRASLRGDTAAALGVAPSTIKNDDVVENSAATVQVRGASSRRQSTSSGCRYAFSIDSANAAAAAASFDAAVTAGTLTTPSTATTTAAGCPSCLDARATSAVQVNAPPPGVSGGGGGGSSSPANAFSVAVAALIAVVLALVL